MTLLQIYSESAGEKILKNRLAFAEVMDKNLVSWFFRSFVYTLI